MTGDPERDADRHIAERDRWERRHPRCAWCECHITSESFYMIDDTMVCAECVEDCKRSTEDYMD